MTEMGLGGIIIPLAIIKTETAKALATVMKDFIGSTRSDTQMTVIILFHPRIFPGAIWSQFGNDSGKPIFRLPSIVRPARKIAD